MRAVIVVACIAVGACGTSPQEKLDAAQVTRTNSVNQCAGQYMKGKRPIVPSVQCINQADVLYFSEVAPGDNDLVQTLIAKRVLLAIEFDKSSMSFDEFSAKWDVLASETTTNFKQRLMASYAFYQANQPKSVDCTTYENTTHCRSR